jgi:glucosamine--fructose-6-phosphate aminotransferase (isomerizing)
VGYDSAGLVYHLNGQLVRYRAKGKLANLEAVVDEHIGWPWNGSRPYPLGHPRAPTEINAQSPYRLHGEIVVVHMESSKNYSALKNELIAKGHVFASETDTEVLAHLIEECLEGDLVAAVRTALSRVDGSYAIGVLWAKEPELLIAARNHSPLVIGGRRGCLLHCLGYFPALLPYTREVIFLDDQRWLSCTGGIIPSCT